jgi:adenylate cyclase
LTDLSGAADGEEPVTPARLAGLLETVEQHLLGDAPTLTRIEVAERAGVPLEMAVQLWRLLGFATNDDDEVAFTEADVEALRASDELTRLGILSEDSQAALVRTWGRSFARLAEWETTLLANVAGADEDPEARLAVLAAEVLPRVESLQTYIWRRHLASASSRLVSVQSSGTAAAELAVCFVDIVGYTSRTKSLDGSELVAWLEGFEDAATGVVVDRGGRIIKTIGDEILFVADDPAAAAEVALLLTERGEDPDDPFPSVRAAIAHGEVVSRLGDVFGPVVNIASRLTSLARPGTVLVDRQAYEVLSGRVGADEDDDPAGAEPPPDDGTPYRFRRMRRSSVKGYARLQSWVLRRA